MLKCIGLKCPYCQEHLFHESYLTCSVDGVSFRKDVIRKIECCLEDELESLQKVLVLIKKEQ